MNATNDRIYRGSGGQSEASLSQERIERKRDYKRLMELELRKSGMDEYEIATALDMDFGEEVAERPRQDRPVYTRLSRRYLSIETLNQHRIEYELDEDPSYVLIKRWVPEYEQKFLWQHTSDLRNARGSLTDSVTGFEFVRNKDKRISSASPLVNSWGSYETNPRRSEVEFDRTQKLRAEKSPRRQYMSEDRREEELSRKRAYERQEVREVAVIERLDDLSLRERDREDIMKSEKESMPVFKARGRYERDNEEVTGLSDKQAESILDQFIATFSV